MKVLLILLGIVSLILGIIGIALPLLPTTPFILLSVLLFSKSSPKMHQWILENKVLGKAIEDWEKHRAIRKEHKIKATVSLVIILGLSLTLMKIELIFKALTASIGLGALIFIWTRPEPKPK